MLSENSKNQNRKNTKSWLLSESSKIQKPQKHHQKHSIYIYIYIRIYIYLSWFGWQGPVFMAFGEVLVVVSLRNAAAWGYQVLYFDTIYILMSAWSPSGISQVSQVWGNVTFHWTERNAAKVMYYPSLTSLIIFSLSRTSSAFWLCNCWGPDFGNFALSATVSDVMMMFYRFCGRFKSDIPAITIDLPHIDPHVWSNFLLLVPWTILAGPWSTRPTWSSSSSIAAPTSRRRPWSTVDDRGRPLSLLMCVNQPHVLVESCWILIFGDDSLNNFKNRTKLHQVAPSSWCTTCQSARCIFVNRSWIQP